MRQTARFAQRFVCVSHDSARYIIEQGIPARQGANACGTAST